MGAGSRVIGATRDLFVPQAARERRLARAEALVRDGHPEQAVPLLRDLRHRVERQRGPCGPACRARWHLAWGYCSGRASQLDEAWVSFQTALRETDDIEDAGLGRVLCLRAHMEIASVALASGKALDVAVQHADEAVQTAGEVEDALALARLTACLAGVARAEHGLGRWESARGHYEDALNVALRIPPPGQTPAGADPDSCLGVWVDARSTAAVGAKEVARTLATLGDTEGSGLWFDRGLAALDGPEHPNLHLTRGVLSLERANCESGDDISAPTRRISWLEAAVREGLAGGEPNGRVLACRAGLDLTAELRELDDGAGVAEQARRVEEWHQGMPADIAVAFGTEAKLALGLGLLDTGDEAGALASLREAIERGRHAVRADARQHAAVACWHVHAVLLADRRIAEAGLALATLEELVPGLGVEVRPAFVALVAYMRGMTCLCEERYDEAHGQLARAEVAARRLERTDPDLVRAAAAGLGNVALECEEWSEAEEHFRRALATLSYGAPSARRRAVRADLMLGVARAIIAMEREDEALALVREAFQTGMSSGCSMGRKVAAHAALIEGDAPMLEPGERRRLYETAARLGRVSGLAQGRDIAEQADLRLADLGA